MLQSRRQFITQTGLLSASLVLPSFLQAGNVHRYKLGLQFYTIRDALSADLKGTLSQVAGFGYQEAETYGFDGKQYYGMSPRDFKQLMDEHGLTTSSGHYDVDKYVLTGKTPDDLKRYVDQCIAGAHILAQQYIVWPWLDPSLRSIDNFKRLAETFNTVGERVKKGGLTFAYHNHDFEFVEQDGHTGYEIILHETDPALVKLEADLYWMSRASSISPVEWFKKQPGRFVLWHIKDMDKKDPDLHTTVGDGIIDFKKIMSAAQQAGVQHLFVEQGNNYVPDALSCVRRSAVYVKKELL